MLSLCTFSSLAQHDFDTPTCASTVSHTAANIETSKFIRAPRRDSPVPLCNNEKLY